MLFWGVQNKIHFHMRKVTLINFYVAFQKDGEIKDSQL
jgi:hypothetical protein